MSHVFPVPHTPQFKGSPKMGRCSKYSNYLPLPYLLIGIVNFPNGNFDNFDLRPPGVPLSPLPHSLNSWKSSIRSSIGFEFWGEKGSVTKEVFGKSKKFMLVR